MGLETIGRMEGRKDTRLWRRFSQVEKLPQPKRKQVVQILDAFLGSEKEKKTGLRKERGYTQAELAERMRIIQALISDYEGDKLRLHSEMVIRFAQAL
jgi:predicted transcriptional regulator